MPRPSAGTAQHASRTAARRRRHLWPARGWRCSTFSTWWSRYMLSRSSPSPPICHLSAHSRASPPTDRPPWLPRPPPPQMSAPAPRPSALLLQDRRRGPTLPMAAAAPTSPARRLHRCSSCSSSAASAPTHPQTRRSHSGVRCSTRWQTCWASYLSCCPRCAAGSRCAARRRSS